MPIYAYECNACGTEHEFLQKFSEGPKRKCPSCGALRLRKQVTAAAFHLKGSGWYVTDFRDNDKKKKKDDSKDKDSGETETKKEAKPSTDSKSSESSSQKSSESSDKSSSKSASKDS